MVFTGPRLMHSPEHARGLWKRITPSSWSVFAADPERARVCGRSHYFPVGDFGQMQRRAWELRLSLQPREEEEVGGKRVVPGWPTLLRATKACGDFNTEQQNGEGSSWVSSGLIFLSAVSSGGFSASNLNGFSHKNVVWVLLFSRSSEQRWLKMEGFIDFHSSSSSLG